jgi:hypothetical protein
LAASAPANKNCATRRPFRDREPLIPARIVDHRHQVIRAEPYIEHDRMKTPDCPSPRLDSEPTPLPPAATPLPGHRHTETFAEARITALLAGSASKTHATATLSRPTIVWAVATG